MVQSDPLTTCLVIRFANWCRYAAPVVHLEAILLSPFTDLSSIPPGACSNGTAFALARRGSGATADPSSTIGVEERTESVHELVVAARSEVNLNSRTIDEDGVRADLLRLLASNVIN